MAFGISLFILGIAFMLSFFWMHEMGCFNVLLGIPIAAFGLRMMLSPWMDRDNN